jgi:hypothetical protein
MRKLIIILALVCGMSTQVSANSGVAENITLDLNVEAERAVICSNVASDRSQGPVVVEDGSSTISTIRGTTIYNDFEVKQGASLIICTNSNEMFQ